MMQNPEEENLRKSTSQQMMFGHYVLQKELGRGGMGVVYKAFDTQLQRDVALKFMMPGTMKGQKRFLVESTVMAKLNHPNIVRFYEFHEKPRPYFVMEYVEGETLADLIKQQRIHSDHLLSLMIDVCNAMAHAHQHNVLHRDLKPSNIIITSEGKPKIMDFGLAKLSNDYERDLSKAGDIVGTVLYMAPEQVKGKAGKQSDIYAIGATIYEALTSQPLFASDNQMNLLFHILHDIPITPRKINSQISPYFEAICLKCLAKNPRKRYDNFRQLVHELKSLRDKKPIRAKKYSFWDTTNHFVGKHKWLILVLCSVVVTVTIAVTQYLNDRVDNEKKQALEKHLENVQRYANQNNFRAVIKSCDKAITIAPSRVDLYVARGIAFFSLGEYDSAILDYGVVIKLNPNVPRIYFLKAECHFRKNEYDIAAPLYQNAIDLNVKGRKGYCYFRLGQIFESRQQHIKALQYYNKAIALSFVHPQLFHHRGRLYYFQKKYAMALRDYNKAMSLYPNNAVLIAGRADIYFAQQKFHKAVDEWKKSLEIKGVDSLPPQSRNNVKLRIKIAKRRLK
ncbi:protein kinase domain-containing protein [Candidatus Uabimicrobium amorphum]|uniref:Serine/threonine protein kinase n=1 Tax=Uabimicrobium amorphum TaxID=2596890 RepID=A0A5S9IQE7_UABAM|nr:serine/threonine-protein kinase [Candidatus Uabimicrobium amorphum]BBM84775.1 serine/threonine protein kinase [Candidatus Uabimicrobium amorphum]